MQTLFLPIGLILVLALGLVYPAPGQFLASCGTELFTVKYAIIIVVFLLAGYQADRRSASGGGKLIGALLAGIGINLILAPALVAALGWTVTIPAASHGLFVGLVTIICVPPTLSSGIIITRTAQGNEIWALMLTVFLVIIGAMVLPLTLSFLLNVGGAVEVPIGAIYLKLIFLVIVPLIIGGTVKWLIGKRQHWLLSYLPSTGVILMVLMAVSQSAGAIKNLPLILLVPVAGCCLGLHGILFAVCFGAGRWLRLAAAEQKALCFVASQKTLPLALFVLLSLPATVLADGDIGAATVVCVMFHFLQIITDSAIAIRWQSNQNAQ